MRQNSIVWGLRGIELLFEGVWFEGMGGCSRIRGTKCRSRGGAVVSSTSMDILARNGQSQRSTQNEASAPPHRVDSEAPAPPAGRARVSYRRRAPRPGAPRPGAARPSAPRPSLQGQRRWEAVPVCTVSDTRREGEEDWTRSCEDHGADSMDNSLTRPWRRR